MIYSDNNKPLVKSGMDTEAFNPPKKFYALNDRRAAYEVEIVAIFNGCETLSGDSIGLDIEGIRRYDLYEESDWNAELIYQLFQEEKPELAKSLSLQNADSQLCNSNGVVLVDDDEIERSKASGEITYADMTPEDILKAIEPIIHIRNSNDSNELATFQNLQYWLARGLGQVLDETRGVNGVVSTYIDVSVEHLDDPILEGIKVRKFGTSEWAIPTLEYLESSDAKENSSEEL